MFLRANASRLNSFYKIVIYVAYIFVLCYSDQTLLYFLWFLWHSISAACFRHTFSWKTFWYPRLSNFVIFKNKKSQSSHFSGSFDNNLKDLSISCCTSLGIDKQLHEPEFFDKIDDFAYERDLQFYTQHFGTETSC